MKAFNHDVYRLSKVYLFTCDIFQVYHFINCTLCVCFQDDNDQLTVVTDRSQGGGSIYNGSLEIMVRHTLSG